MAKQKRNIGQELTDAIKAMMLEHGTDWTKPFQSLATVPTNAVTGNPYRGLNALWLGLIGVQWAAGYKQWQTIGANVVKGGKSVAITAPLPIKDKEDPTKLAALLFRPTNIFPSSQVEGWTPPAVETTDTTEVLAEVDAYVANCNAHIEVGGSQPCYIPSRDQISMPRREAFTETDTSTATETYYSTLLHELIHWTGHKSRCNRLDDKSKRGYAFEELVAEIGSVLLSVRLGVSPTVRPDHAKYLNGWLKALDDDQSYITDAAKLAQKAIDYLDGLQTVELEQAA